MTISELQYKFYQDCKIAMGKYRALDPQVWIRASLAKFFLVQYHEQPRTDRRLQGTSGVFKASYNDNTLCRSQQHQQSDNLIIEAPYS